ncbi:helix-turn-helix transcriptional regulator [Actinopolyspora mortivallis]|uniref:helix-turn-helix transcriptional regulator n=1 Tax=Actinopolyspora mortivallis TaxID=33906 RepID=UPI001C636675|nr:LuxR C-terminal-related transcriptional regulator [Actinopolyspora mortivallis]
MSSLSWGRIPSPYRESTTGKQHSGPEPGAGVEHRSVGARSGPREQHGALDTLDDVLTHRQHRVVLLEGARGAGKSHVLTRGRELATEKGYQVAHHACEGIEYPPALFSALGHTTLPSTPGFAGTDAAHTRMLLVERAGSVAEHLSTQKPLLVSLDDVQFADQISMLALRTLPRQLRGKSVVWMLTRCTDREERSTRRLYELLERSVDTVRLTIEPLSPSEVADLARALCQARPERDLLSHLEALDGNPRNITELVNGYLDEGKIRTENGLAHLTESGEQDRTSALAMRLHGLPVRPALPRRFLNLVEEQLGTLSRRTRLVLQVAAVLGPTFRPDDITGVLGEPSAGIITEVQEALDSGLLVTTAQALAFRSDLLWQSVLESLPTPLRTALHRQVADAHLAHGGPVTEAAIHLLQGTSRDGTATTRGVLVRAAREALSSSPAVAAELAQCGLELTQSGDPEHTELTTVAVDALTRAGPLAEAVSTARAALTRSLPPSAEAEVRYCLSVAETLGGHATEAQEEPDERTAGEHLEKFRVSALQREFFRDRDAATKRADELLNSPSDTEPTVRVTAMQVRAQAHWEAGELHAGLHLAREAAELARHTPDLLWHTCPRLPLVLMLVHLGDPAEAEELVTAQHHDIDRRGTRTLAGVPHLLKARTALVTDRLGQALVEAETGLAKTAQVGLSVHDALAWDTLTTIALRRGELARANETLTRLETSTPADTVVRARHRWLRAELALAHDDTEAANTAVHALLDHPAHCRALLSTEPVAGARLARLGDERARTAVATACRRLAEDNPGFPVLATAAAHVRAVLDHEPETLERAEPYPDSWSRGVRAEDLAALWEGTDETRAVEYLDQALADYDSHGAERDAARVRRRLRQLGVRRRHWRCTKRPANGWDSLTETESSVATLVAQGLTNRQVAKQMFLSPHTIGFHLRQIFRKLGVRSRIELARDWGHARD